ncbi:MAG: hypothetical protein ACYC91_16775 [Solirubrobacteraceae bacterium]
MTRGGVRTRARHAALIAVVGVVLTCAGASSALAAAGDLDPGFGVGGIRELPVGSDGNAHAAAVAALADGGSVVAGKAAQSGATVAAIAELNADGSVRTSFGGTGVSIQLGATLSEFAAVAPVPGSTDVVAGGLADTSSGATDVLLARFHADGTLDTAFQGAQGVPGTAIVPVGTDGNARAEALVVDPSTGTITVTGQAAVNATNQAFLMRVGPQGAVQGTPVTFTAGDSGFVDAHALVAEPSGGFLVAGEAEDQGSRRVLLAAFTATGALDTTFGSGGILLRTVGSGDASALGAVVQTSGRIVIAGTSLSNGRTQALLAGFTPAGAIDPSFGAQGITLEDLGTTGNTTAASVTTGPGGVLVIAGQTGTVRTGASITQPFVARFDANGVADRSFGASQPVPGTVVTTCSLVAGFTGATVDGQSRITAAGFDGGDSSHQDILVARYEGGTGPAGTGGACSNPAGSGGGNKPPPPPPPGPGGHPPGGGPGAGGSCTKVTAQAFGVLQATGCFTVDGPRIIARGQLDLSGLLITPSACTTLVWDTKVGTLHTVCSSGGTGAVSIAIGDVPLYMGGLDISIPKVDGEISGFPNVGGFANLKGFPLSGSAKLEAHDAGINLTLSAELPKPFDHVSGDVVLRADLVHGLSVDSVKLKASDFTLFGVIGIKDLSASYTVSTDTWTGSLGIQLPFPKYTVSGGLGVKDDKFLYATASIDGLNIAVAPSVFLQKIGLGVQADPFIVQGQVGLSFGPQIAGTTAVAVNGTFTFLLPAGGGWAARIEGKATLAGADLAGAYVEADDPAGGPFILFFGGNVKFSTPLFGCVALCASGMVQGYFGGGSFDVFGEVDVTLLEVFTSKGQFDLSTNIVGACANVSFLGISFDIGGVYTWASKDFHAIGGLNVFGLKLGEGGGACDLGPYRPTAPKMLIGTTTVGGSGSSDHGVRNRLSPRAGTTVTAAQLTVPAGRRGLTWQVKGSGTSAPHLTITAPDGTTVTSGAKPNLSTGILALEDPSSRTTFVILGRPKPGKWTLTPDRGSITAVTESDLLPPPSVTAKVRMVRGGDRFVLSYHVVPRVGQRVEFVERAGKGSQVLGTAGGTRGTLAFTPAPGKAGRRSIVAEVLQNHTPRAAIRVASFTVPPPPVLPAPKRLRIKRSGVRILTTWKSVPGAHGYLVDEHLSSGQKSQLVVRGTAVEITALDGRAGMRVAVSPLGRWDRLGHAAAARLPALAAPRLRGRPRIVGRPRVGNQVRCAVRITGGAGITVLTEWTRNSHVIASAPTTGRLRLGRLDRGRSIGCEIVAHNLAGIAIASARPVIVH